MDVATRRRAWLLLLLLLGALLLRSRCMGDVFLEGHVLPFDPDSSYHLWRIEEAARHPPWPPRFDPFVNAPQGAAVIYPDGFDGLMGTVAFVLSGGAPTRRSVQLVALLANPLLGTLALLALYPLGRQAFGRRAALGAVALGAMLPGHVFPGLLGRVDHHVFELLVPPLVLALLLAEGRRAARVLGAASLLGALPYLVPTALLHAALLGAALVCAGLRAAWLGARPATLLLDSAVAFAGAAAVVLPDALTRHGLAYEAPSRLPLLLLLLGAGALGLLYLASWGGMRRLLGGLLLLGLAGAVGAAVWLRDALGYLGGGGPLALVVEAQPVWADPWRSLQTHTLALPLLPVLFVALAWPSSTRSVPPAAWAVSAMGLGGVALVCLQGRFEALLAGPLALGLGAGAAALWRGRMRWAVVLAGATVLAPAVLLLSQLTLLTPDALAVLEATVWLRQHTPPVGPRQGRTSPPYTLLSLWGEGSHLAYLAERPVVAGSFFHGEYEAGYRDAISILYGDGDPEPVLARRRVRYLVLPAQPSWIEGAHRNMLGLGPPQAPTLYTQLYDFDGSSVTGQGGALVQARGQLRLRFESAIATRRDGRIVPAMKIFERVPGALLEGSCSGRLVRLRLRHPLESGRVVEFLSASPCQGGRFRLRLPYPGSAELIRGPSLEAITVTEQDVQLGRSVPAP
ncbi:MAG: hypothetical protein RMK29_14475 [Myxococcales bacterium]|nr:hypothetical protein [Myxococcales bacterium]